MYTDPVGPLFSSEEVLSLTIQWDWDAIQDEREKKSKYHPATILMNNQTIPVRLRPRGNTRKRKDVCELPPLKIDFEDNQLEDSLFRGQEEVKLVTYCQGNEPVIVEYLIYRLYGIIEPYSLNVRLAKINYQDEHSQENNSESYAFFLEDIDHMAERLGGKERNERIHPDSLDRKVLTTLYVFQYMIGNIDWDIKMMKNIKLISFPDDRLPVAVPYDFDYTQMVDAPYFPQYDGISIDRRQFKKLCRKEEEFEAVFNQFKEKEQEIIDFIKDVDVLRSPKRKEILNLIKLFYREIADPTAVKQIFFDTCKEG